MADLIAGLTLVEGFSRFVPALLVLLLLFAILQYTGALGKNLFVDVLVSLCVAVLVMISPKASYVLSFMAPWFVVLIFFIIFMLIAFKAMGVSDGQIMVAMSNYRGIAWTIIFIAIGIAAVGLGNAIGQQLLEGGGSSGDVYIPNQDGTYTAPDGSVVRDLPTGASTDFQNNLTSTLFHPTILGFALIGLIGAFTVFFMTRAYT